MSTQSGSKWSLSRMIKMADSADSWSKSWDAGADIGDAMVSPYAARSKASALRWQGRQQQKALREQGKLLAWNAGEAQREGLEAAALRYDALGREIAAQRVRAAGSGIDMSSDVAARAERSSRKAAAQDVDKMARSAYYRALNYNRGAQNAFFNADQARIQGDLQAKIAKANGWANFGIGLAKGTAKQFFATMGLCAAPTVGGGTGFGTGGAGGGNIPSPGNPGEGVYD